MAGHVGANGSDMDELAIEVDERLDEVPAKTTREVLARMDDRSGFVLVALGRIAREIAIMGRRLLAIEVAMEAKADKARIDSMRPKMDSISSEIDQAKRDELAGLRDWRKWAIRGAIGLAWTAVTAAATYIATHGLRLP